MHNNTHKHVQDLEAQVYKLNWMIDLYVEFKCHIMSQQLLDRLHDNNHGGLIYIHSTMTSTRQRH